MLHNRLALQHWQRNVLTSIWFTLSLAVLFLNDHYWKYTYANWWTGKASDVVGLFIFPIFWTVFFPKFKKQIFLLTVLGFVFWNSSLSNTFIDYWNGLPLFKVARTIDGSDFWALLVLPIAYHIPLKKNCWCWSISPHFLAVAAFLTFTSTSMSHRYITDEAYYESAMTAAFKVRSSKEQVLSYLTSEQYQMQQYIDTIQRRGDTIEMKLTRDLEYHIPTIDSLSGQISKIEVEETTLPASFTFTVEKVKKKVSMIRLQEGAAFLTIRDTFSPRSEQLARDFEWMVLHNLKHRLREWKRKR